MGLITQVKELLCDYRLINVILDSNCLLLNCIQSNLVEKAFYNIDEE